MPLCRAPLAALAFVETGPVADGWRGGDGHHVVDPAGAAALVRRLLADVDGVATRSCITSIDSIGRFSAMWTQPG